MAKKSGFRNTESVLKKIADRITVPFNQEELKQISKKTRDLIVGMVRSGRNPKTDQKLLPITDEWKERRDVIAGNNGASDVYSKGRSNLSLTGEFLASIEDSVKVREQQVIVEPTGDHSQYIGAKGKPIGRRVENKVIARGQAEQGRDFLGLSLRLKQQIMVLMRRLYRAKIRKARQGGGQSE